MQCLIMRLEAKNVQNYKFMIMILQFYMYMCVCITFQFKIANNYAYYFGKAEW